MLVGVGFRDGFKMEVGVRFRDGVEFRFWGGFGFEVWVGLRTRWFRDRGSELGFRMEFGVGVGFQDGVRTRFRG